MKLKVCGITQKENMLEVAALQPDYMGFIFYPPSPRDVSNTIDQLQIMDISLHIKKIAVLVDQPYREAFSIIDRHKFDMVQLHGNESPGYCMELRKHAKIIKVFRVKDTLPDNLDLYENNCDFFLFDTKADKPGGTGVVFDHRILDNYTLDVPFFLSGGIGPEHIKRLQSINYPMLHALDINSKFETTPGIKNIDLLKNAIHLIRNC